MMKIVIAVIILALYSIQTVAYEYPWKALPPFEISFVDGYQEIYGVEERIIFYVEGRSPAGIETEPRNGFNVQVHINDPVAQKSLSGVNGTYDKNRRAWRVELSAPNDYTKFYQMEIGLYCGADKSPCAEIYGIAAQTSKIFKLQVR